MYKDNIWCHQAQLFATNLKSYGHIWQISDLDHELSDLISSMQVCSDLSDRQAYTMQHLLQFDGPKSQFQKVCSDLDRPVT